MFPASHLSLVIALSVALVFSLATTPTQAELTPQQKARLAEIANLLRQAGTLYQQDDFQASGERIEAAMAAIDALIDEGGADAYDAVAAAFPRIANAHALLELEGITLRPFVRPQRPRTAAAPLNQMKPSAAGESDSKRSPRVRPGQSTAPAEPVDSGPSFVRDVAPILVQHCGRCHINATRGNFNMANFALLAEGPPEGRVIFPGDVVGSRLIETIETGDMPRGGGKVPPTQLQTLKDWVLAGAKYDGNLPTIPLVALAASSPAQAAQLMTTAPPPAPAVLAPTGKETVSFAKQIAPLLLENCNGCHLDAMQTRGGLRMDSFAMLMRGGDSGQTVLPNRAAASLLIRKLKGEEGTRMPAGGRPPLSDEAINLVSTWIEEGAVFDGESAEQPLDVMASLAWAKSASEEELSERRMQLARKNLQLLGSTPQQWVEQSDKSFFVIGNVSESAAIAVTSAANKVLGKVKAFADPRVIAGRVTVFAFAKRYDYSEFAKMVERRSVPADWQSHWKYDGMDAYIAVLATASDSDAAIEARLVGPLASLAVTMQGGDVPRWFAEGIGRAAAAKLAARELPNVQSWNSGLPAAVAAMKDGAQLVKNNLPPEQIDLIGYGLASAMLSRHQRRHYDALLKGLEKSQSFDDAFAAAFGVTPAAYVDRWKPYATTGIDLRRR